MCELTRLIILHECSFMFKYSYVRIKVLYYVNPFLYFIYVIFLSIFHFFLIMSKWGEGFIHICVFFVSIFHLCIWNSWIKGEYSGKVTNVKYEFIIIKKEEILNSNLILYDILMKKNK